MKYIKDIKDMNCTEKSPTRHAGTIVLLSHALSSAFFFTTTVLSGKYFRNNTIIKKVLSQHHCQKEHILNKKDFYDICTTSVSKKLNM